MLETARRDFDKVARARMRAGRISSGVRRSLTRAALPALAIALMPACSEPTPASVVRILDRPTHVAFACVGDMRVTGGGPADASQEVIQSPVPVPACASWGAGEPPPGQGALAESNDNPLRPTLYPFFLQSARGSVAVARYNRPQAGDDADLAASRDLFPRILDADRFAPGDDTIPIGNLPVGLVTDTSGCHLLTANAGTCDLSSLDVMSAIDSNVQASVYRTPVVDAAGEPIGAKPHSMVGDPRAATVGVECPSRAQGLLYITYPDCGLVAAVDAASGEVLAGVLFHEDGSVEITDGHVGCTGGCGEVVPPPGQPEPISLEIDGEAQRLYIGMSESSSLMVVDLSEDLLPVAVSAIPVEGDVGILDIAVSDLIEFSGLGSPLRFVYAVATDRTVRVVEVEQLATECETQADTRYLHDVRDTTFLPCMPVGDPRTPPRRLGAHSPGIHSPDGAAPLSVAFAAVDNPDSSSLPLDGHVAYITTSTARLLMVDVNNDLYPNTEPIPPADPEAEFNPYAVDIALALPHRLRDVGSQRDLEVESCVHPDPGTFGSAQLRPRLEADPTRLTSSDMNAQKGHLLPNMRRLSCSVDDDTQTAIPELSIMADVDTYKFAFPDLGSIAREESWVAIWEGPVTLDPGNVVIDGPSVRHGTVSTDAGMELADASGPFCRMGAEPYDVVELLGCEPSRGDSDCGTGETCYLHPDAPTNVTTGVCLPTDRLNQLSGQCQDFLTSLRQYTITSTHRGRLGLTERRRVLRTSPSSGCVDADQCQALYRTELALASADHPYMADELEPSEPHTFACEPDPSHRPSPARCVMTCEVSDDCENGYSCSNGYCVAGPEPPAECVEAAQRYRVHVGEQFAVLGSITGFLHNRIVDPDPGSDECIDDPAASPLSIGRIPLDAPPCTSDDITDITPNPCSTTVTHTESAFVYEDLATCSFDTNPATPEVVAQERSTTAIRFRNPSFTMHLVDPYPVLDAQCNGDRMGPRADFPVVPSNYIMSFRIIGGLVPFAQLMAVDTSRVMMYPIAIEPGPWGNMWIMDQGDRSSTIRGQVIWFSPERPLSLDAGSYLR